eukprot:IDg8781t1
MRNVNALGRSSVHLLQRIIGAFRTLRIAIIIETSIRNESLRKCNAEALDHQIDAGSSILRCHYACIRW